MVCWGCWEKESVTIVNIFNDEKTLPWKLLAFTFVVYSYSKFHTFHIIKPSQYTFMPGSQNSLWEYVKLAGLSKSFRIISKYKLIFFVSLHYLVSLGSFHPFSKYQAIFSSFHWMCLGSNGSGPIWKDWIFV